jgi:hypothetical protein
LTGNQLSIYIAYSINHRFDVDKLDEGVVRLLDVDLEYFSKLLEPVVDLGPVHLPGDVAHVQGARSLRVELVEFRITRPLIV